jgi:hypothetical protein
MKEILHIPAEYKGRIYNRTPEEWSPYTQVKAKTIRERWKYREKRGYTNAQCVGAAPMPGRAKPPEKSPKEKLIDWFLYRRLA